LLELSSYRHWLSHQMAVHTWNAAWHWHWGSVELMRASKTRYRRPPAWRMAYCWAVLAKANIVSACPAFSWMLWNQQHQYLWLYMYLKVP